MPKPHEIQETLIEFLNEHGLETLLEQVADALASDPMEQPDENERVHCEITYGEVSYNSKELGWMVNYRVERKPRNKQ